MKKNYYSGTSWEKKVAYSRAKRAGNMIFVAGTTAVDDNGEIIGVGDMYAQTVYAFQKALYAVRELGGNLEDVVRTRMFVTDIDMFDDIAKAHKLIFEGVDPVASCLEITRLVDKNLLVEVELDVVI